MAHSAHLLDEEDSGPHAGLSRNLLQVLWRRKAYIVLGAVVGLALGSLFYTQQTPIYQSNSQMVVIKKRAPDQIISNQGVNPGASYVEDFLPTQIVILRSPVIIELAVRKRLLNNLQSLENRDPVAVISVGLNVTRDNPKDSVSGPSNIVNLSYRGTVSKDCREILDAILDSYQEFLNGAYQSTSDKTVELIKKAQDTYLTRKGLAQNKLKELISDSPVDYTEKNTPVYRHQIQKINTERLALNLREIDLKSKVQRFEMLLQKGLIQEGLAVVQVANQGKLDLQSRERLSDDQLFPLWVEEAKLLEEFGKDHPNVVRIRAAIKRAQELQQQLVGGPDSKKRKEERTKTQVVDGASTVGLMSSPIGQGPLLGGFALIAEKNTEVPLNPIERYLFTLRHELGGIIDLQFKLKKELEELKKVAGKLSIFEEDEKQNRDEITSMDELLKETWKRLNEMNVIKDAGGFDARVLSKPKYGNQVAPVALQTILIGFILGGLAGIGLAYLAEYSDRSFRSSEEVRKRLGLPLVGHIPFLQPDPEAKLRVDRGESIADPMLISHYRSMSVEAESYRAVRTALFFCTQDAGHKVIQVTSPTKGDGKSLFMANLAVSIAQSGKKVILIDADCRRPRQHKVFALSGSVGTVNVLAGEVDFHAAVKQTCCPGLELLPAGPIRANPAELLTSPRFQDLLDTVRQEYDYVLVDTPPLLAVTDPCIVAGLVDGLFLVIRLSRDARPKAERAREILDSLGVKVHGVVVNGITRAGGAGLYAAERYDYTENYEETDEEGGDGYYTADSEAGQEEKPPELTGGASPPSGEAVTPASNHHSPRSRSTGQPGARGGLMGWLLNWWA